MIDEQKKEKRAELQALFKSTGIRATKIAEVTGYNKTTVYAAINPEINRRGLSDEVLQKVEAYLRKIAAANSGAQ